MRNLSTDAFVLRVTLRGTSDKLLTLISPKEGRFYAILKGGHSMKNREVAATEPYTWSSFEFYEKNGFKWVKSATALQAFPGVRYDSEKLFLAAYFSDVVFELSDENAPAGDILPLCLNAMHMLSVTKDDDARIKAAFEMRAAVIGGFAPALEACGRCGCAVGEDMYLDVMNGALICAPCLSRETALLPAPEVDETGVRHILLPLCASAVAALHFVATAPPKRVFSFRLTSARAEDLFGRAAEGYLLHHLERGFPTLENYKRLLAIRRQMIKS
ncbi:MAG: DNA repair protein RecO [Clostridia bacterium]|nr:DNA repair protein RecO [Clostridia bacterium]